MSAIPYNTARGAASSLQMSPPFAFSDVTMSVFPLRASLARLDTFCNNYLNQAPHLVQFKPFIPFVYLVILDYGRMSLQAANMGWVSQREVAFGIPLRWLNTTPEGAVFHDWAFTSPFIFVDNEMSMSTGREVYGWPKLLAKLDPSVSEWVRDPHGARRVFQVSTKRAAHAYAGEVQEYRPFLSVYQHRAAGIFDVPPSMDTITKPLQQLSGNVAGFTRLGADLLRTFSGMASDGITGSPVLPDFSDQDMFKAQLRPEKLKSWTSLKDWVPGIRDMLWSLFPRTYANTINFKQFRDAGDPHGTCYQAITSARMPVKSVTRGGFLGPQNMLLGQLDGGFRIDVHSLAGLPIVESLGLEVAEEREADGTLVSSLAPVCPLWIEVDMTYGLAETLVMRGRANEWQTGPLMDRLRAEQAAKKPTGAAQDPAPGPETETPADNPQPPASPTSSSAAPKPSDGDDLEDAFDLDYIRTMNFFNTARGATEAVGGEFTMPNAQIRVLPLKADFAKMNAFVSEYLRVENHLRFEAWGDFVYLIICDFDQVNSTLNAVAKRRAREINLAVPVKCYSWFEDETYRNEDPSNPGVMHDKGYRSLVTTGFVSAFSYVDDTGTAITASEVAGIPTMGSAITSPQNDWLSIDLSKSRAKRDILEVSAQVLPALMSGAQAQERALIQLHSHTPPQTKIHESQHESVNRWVSLLTGDLKQKQKQSEGEYQKAFAAGQGFCLQLLGGDLPINQFSLKQFRDSRFTENACYQGLVQRGHRIEKLMDMRELEEPLHVSITDYPTQPISEILGLKPKFSYPGPDRIVHVFEALRPFSISADLVREGGNTLFERFKSRRWQRVDDVEQIFGWRPGDHADGIKIAQNADSYTDDRPVELTYICKLPDRKRPFRLRPRRVSQSFLHDHFELHLNTGELSNLAIRERQIVGRVDVTTDPDLFRAVTTGAAPDIAAFNAQVARAGKSEQMTQADAAGLMSVISPATVLDSVLSLQWGLSPGAKRRKFPKSDFCVPTETTPVQFSDVLFPETERLHGYWPTTEKFYVKEISRRSAEVMSFRSDLGAFIGYVGTFAPLSAGHLGKDLTDKPMLKRYFASMLEQLTNEEQAQFSKVGKQIIEAKEDQHDKITDLFSEFANVMLPKIFSFERAADPRNLTSHMIAHSQRVPSADWAAAEAALPRLFEAGRLLFEDNPEYYDGLKQLTEILSDKAARNKAERKSVEMAEEDHSPDHDFYLKYPYKVLSDRLSKLVMGKTLADADAETERDGAVAVAVKVARKTTDTS